MGGKPNSRRSSSHLPFKVKVINLESISDNNEQDRHSQEASNPHSNPNLLSRTMAAISRFIRYHVKIFLHVYTT